MTSTPPSPTLPAIRTTLAASLLALAMGADAAVETGRAPALCDPAKPNCGARKAAPRRVPAKAVRARQYLEAKTLTVVAGIIKLLPMQGKVWRVALGNGNVLSTTTVDGNLLLIAEQVGSTSLLVWTDNVVHSYLVHVVPVDPAQVRAKVDALMAGMPGVSMRQVGTDLVLSGSAHKEGLMQLTTALKDTPGVVFNVKEDKGSPYTRSVLFRLHFIEVKRSLLEKIGVDWAKEATGPTFGAMGVAKNTGVYADIPPLKGADNLLAPVPPFVTSAGSRGGLFLGLATTITSRLNLGIADGDARVLASPELTAKSGGQARLQVGGEVPIPLSGAFGATTVEFKPYGIIFSIEPHIDANDIITAKVSTELSQIDPAVSVAGIPGFVTRNTATEVSLKQGEIVALSGLVNSEMSTAIDRVPGLSRIPIFGRLFRSDDFRNSKSELIVLLEPEIITAGDGLSQQLLRRGLDHKREFENKVKEQQQRAFPPLGEAGAGSGPRN